MEEVILVNELDEALGKMEKMEAHIKAVMHRAFSVFVFNDKGDMLLQQRAISKYHSGGLWTNACCSHPRPGEATLTAAQRRLQEEMGFITPLKKVFDFTYRSVFDNGLTEYEYDHVFVGNFEGIINPNKHEVGDFCFMRMNDIEASLSTHPDRYTTWFHIAFPKISNWWQQHY